MVPSNSESVPTLNPVKYATVILVHPPKDNKGNLQKILAQNLQKIIGENLSANFIPIVPKNESSTKNLPEINQVGNLQAYSSFESKNQDNEFNLQNESGSSKQRSNKHDTLKEIDEKHIDHGRGGNCVASNICKTLVKIVLAHLHGMRLQNFNHYIKKYQVKSQKQNSVIIMLLLHKFGKQKKLSLEMYEHMVGQFHQSLKESEHNCQRKMREQEQRRSFHGKNKRMYKMFSKINKEIYQRSVSNLKFNEIWNIKELQEMVSNSYDRKQRDVEKATNKIKSIILNHDELKQWFDYWYIDIETVFYEALEFAYRRNLPKRCKQIKDSTSSIIKKIKAQRDVQSEEDKYMMCYTALKLIGEKEKEIWSEFMTNLLMKQQYNKTELERQRLRLLLEKEIPLRFNDERFQIAQGIKVQERRQKQETRVVMQRVPMCANEYETKCKIQQETSDFEHEQIGDNHQNNHQKKPFNMIYKELREFLEF